MRLGTLYASSNRDSVNAINVTAIDISNNNQISTLHYANVRKANGGAAFYPPGASANSSADQQIVWCDQGDETHPSQLTGPSLINLRAQFTFVAEGGERHAEI